MLEMPSILSKVRIEDLKEQSVLPMTEADVLKSLSDCLLVKVVVGEGDSRFYVSMMHCLAFF